MVMKKEEIGRMAKRQWWGSGDKTEKRPKGGETKKSNEEGLEWGKGKIRLWKEGEKRQ